MEKIHQIVSLTGETDTSNPYKGRMNPLHATYAFNTWMKRKRPAKTVFLSHVVHDNLKKETCSLTLFSRGNEDQVVPGVKSPSISQGNNWVSAN